MVSGEAGLKKSIEELSGEVGLKKSIEELNRVTGLGLMLSEDDMADPEDTAEKIRQITSAFKEKNSKSAFVAELLDKKLSETEIEKRAARFHMSLNTPRSLFVIETDADSTDVACRILRQMFTSQGDMCVIMRSGQIVLIRPALRGNSRMDEETTARMIVDMLGSEAMVRARAAFARTCELLAKLPEAYQNALTALAIGRIFYASETVIDFGRLGIGRLINELPEDTCRLFLQEVYGDREVVELDEETQATIDTFFGNNLNISETARQLYIHRNTLVYRLEKLHQLTGLDIRVFEDAMVYKIAAMVRGYLKNLQENE